MLNLKTDLGDAVVKYSSGIISDKDLYKIKDKNLVRYFPIMVTQSLLPCLTGIENGIWLQKKENTAAGISPKSQKEHSSSIIKEHMLFALLCIYVYVCECICVACHS